MPCVDIIYIMKKKFKASIHPSFITKVDRLFDNRFKTIIGELIQNCRRAGATEVNITLESQSAGMFVTVEDNGIGLNDPEKLLSLSESAWPEDSSAMEEDPAGMGFFSLSRMGAVVMSRDWAINLTPEMFTGQKEVDVLSATPRTNGMKIAFTVPRRAGETDSGAQFSIATSEIEDIVRYAPIAVRVNGVLQAREDFLEGAIVREVWNGLEIGIVRQQRYDCSIRSGVINFFGHVVPCPSTNATELRRVFREFKDIGKAVAVQVRDKWVEVVPSCALSGSVGLGCRIDVQHANFLRLKHPDRVSIVEGTAWDLVLVKISELMAKATVEYKKRTRSFTRIPKSLAEEWKLKHGISVEADAYLWKFESAHYADYDTRRYAPGEAWPYRSDKSAADLPALLPINDVIRPMAVIVPLELGSTSWALATTLQEAEICSGSEKDIILLKACEAYTGYPWYDEIPVITQVDMRVNGKRIKGLWCDEQSKANRTSEQCDAFFDKLAKDRAGGNLRVSSLSLILILSDGREVELATTMVLSNDDAYSEAGCTIGLLNGPLASKLSFTVDDLQEAIYFCMFNPSEDDNRDDVDESVTADSKALANTIFYDPTEAYRCQLEDETDKFYNSIRWLRDPSEKSVIRSITLTLTQDSQGHLNCKHEFEFRKPRKKKKAKAV